MRIDPTPNRLSKAALTAPLNADPKETKTAKTTPLPSIGADSLALSGTRSSAASLTDVLARAKAAITQKPEWTMAVNLTTTLEGGFGAAPKAQELKDLAKETEGKPITIVAQQVHQEESGPVVERFVIKDGKVTSHGAQASEGFAKDLENLVGWAAQDHPGQRMGLIVQSHGQAIDGVNGDNGEASLTEISEALSRALKTDGRSKLDLLNFDACLMGQQEVIHAMRGVADHVVASSEIETGDGRTMGRVDGQPTQEILRALLADPGMDGEQFGTKTIELASRAARPFDRDGDGVPDPELPISGTPTLTHYDMREAGPLLEATDALGKALSDALKEPGSRRAIEEAIAQSPQFSPGQDRQISNRHQRDLKGFVEALQGAIASGKLADPTGRIQQSLAASLEGLEGLVDAHFGVPDLHLPGFQKAQDYDRMGGLGVFLPSAEFARGTPDTQNSPLGRILVNTRALADQLEGVNGQPKMPDEAIPRAADLFEGSLLNQLSPLRKSLPPEREAELGPLFDSYRAVSEAALQDEVSREDLVHALRSLEATVGAVQGSEFGTFVAEHTNRIREARVSEVYALAEPHMPEGWKQFVQVLRTSE